MVLLCKAKYDGKAKLCFMDTDSFISYIKTDNIYNWRLITNFLKEGLTLQVMRWIDHYQTEKTRKLLEYVKVRLSWKTYSFFNRQQRYREKGKTHKKVCCKNKNFISKL